MLLELTLRRIPPHPPDGSPADGIRVLALLPSRWRKELSNAAGDLVIRVQSDDSTSAQMRDEIARILQDPAVSSWSLVGCTVPAISTPPPWRAARPGNGSPR